MMNCESARSGPIPVRELSWLILSNQGMSTLTSLGTSITGAWNQTPHKCAKMYGRKWAEREWTRLLYFSKCWSLLPALTRCFLAPLIYRLKFIEQKKRPWKDLKENEQYITPSTLSLQSFEYCQILLFILFYKWLNYTGLGDFLFNFYFYFCYVNKVVNMLTLFNLYCCALIEYLTL